ncbi:MAG: hypothetical protein Q7S15_02305 [bacterium]|nr:hypothetical protein [bacterium]
MEEDKDTRKNNEQDHSLEIVKLTSFLKADERFAFFYKKTERLVVALYMISNLLSDKEPLKWDLRELGLRLLSLNTSFGSSSVSDKAVVLETVGARVVEVVAKLEIARLAGLISEMNFTLLRREFGSLLELLAALEHDMRTKGNFKLPHDFFAAERHQSVDELLRNIKVSLGQNRASQGLNRPTVPNVPSLGASEISSVDLKKNKRRSAILSLVKKKGNITIKDVSEVVHNCSEKTIQRELLSMVSEGVLKKEGERRWSRYSVA